MLDALIIPGPAAPAWAIVLPLGAGVAAFVAGRRAGPWLVVAGAALTLFAVAVVAAQVAAGGPLVHAVGGWAAPLGIELHADGWSALMLVMTGVVGAAVTVYALAYFAPAGPHADSAPGFWCLWPFLWGGLNALFLSADVFNLYVSLEVMSLAAVALVALGGGESVGAALRYLLVSIVGSLAYLLGVAFLYGEYGVLSVAGLAQAAQPTPATWVAAALMVAGLMLKTALYPLHFWLPAAHASAPTPVSAALSGLVVKASFYVLLRLWLEVFPAAPGAAQVAGALGALAVLAGSAAALAAARLKLLVAYSTVAQLGYLFLAVPLVGVAAAQGAAFEGTVMHMLSHACAKAALFMAAGNVLYLLGRDDIDDVTRAARAAPWSMAAFGVAGASLIGLPPTGGFMAKWLLLTAAIEAGQWWWALVLVVGGFLAAGYVFRVVRRVFRQDAPVPQRRVPRLMEWVPAMLALIAFVLGIAAGAPLALLRGVPS
ncbi:MAG TPA: proton-conducting transporter membrane subunit [Pelomicrobium sp.]|nr:proton-conducting transporter membrane subunit [Pelomicrobium sp.]